MCKGSVGHFQASGSWNSRENEEEAEKALQLLEIGSNTVERKEVQEDSGEEAAEELVETKKVVEDLEREDKSLGLKFKI